jgi:ferredoxin
MKTAPLYRSLKIDGTNKQARVLCFEGNRAEESLRRSGQSRIGKGVKHNMVINASPILYWNTTEIYLYLFKHKLPMNYAYRQGKTRVGCIICPYSSKWDDMLANKLYNDELNPFISRIENSSKAIGIQDMDDYIKERNWKLRAGGREMKFPSFMEVVSVKPDLVIKCHNPQKDVLTWLVAVGKYTIKSEKIITGEIKYQNLIFKFTVESNKDEILIRFENTANYPAFQGLLKRAFYKSTYCINCESCEVECPTGALSILPDATINAKQCTHCHKCLEFHDLGCIVANSLAITGNNNSNNMKLIGYNTFGLNGEWLDVFMSSIDTYFADNTHGLNPKEQLPNFVKWLVQAEILDDTRNRKVTLTGRLLSNLYADMPDLVWEIIWINLSYNSPIAKWYKEKMEWNSYFTQADVQELVHADCISDSPRSIKNIVYALFRTFRESPIGQMGLLVEAGKLSYRKEPYADLSREALAYSLYKYTENKGIKSFRVSDLYSADNKQGIYREFGITKMDVERHLRSLNSDVNRVLVAELNMGLDHITLRDDLDALKALSILTNE